MGAEDKVQVLDISKVKDITKMKMKPNHVLIEVINTSKSKLIISEHAINSTVNKAVIVMVGSNVTTVSVGDVVVDMALSNVEYLLHGEKKYSLCDVYNIILAVSPDNYTA